MIREKTAMQVSRIGTARRIGGIAKDFQLGAIPGLSLIVNTDSKTHKKSAPASPI